MNTVEIIDPNNEKLMSSCVARSEHPSFWRESQI